MFGQVGFSSVWVELSVRVNWESLPFRPISAFGVEIYNRQYWESLPFSRVFRILGRDSRMTATGFFTFSADFRSAKSVVASFCSHVITCTSICTKNSLRHNVPPTDTPCLRPQGLISSDSDPLLNCGKSLF